MAAESKPPERPTPQGAFGDSSAKHQVVDPGHRRHGASPAAAAEGISGLGFGTPKPPASEEEGGGSVDPTAAGGPAEQAEADPASGIAAMVLDEIGDFAEEPLLPSLRPRAPSTAPEVALDEIADSATRVRPTSEPAALGYAESHDAWTMEKLSRQSTVPPEAADDVLRLREISAQRDSELPEDAWGGGALDLVDHSQPAPKLGLIGEMEELYALDDLTGALRCAELVLGQDPENSQARRCADNCRSRLVQLYCSKIGNMDVPVALALEDAELRWLGLDHRSGFLLSRVDGLSTVDELLDICGMPRLEALKAIVDLIDRGAIHLVS